MRGQPRLNLVVFSAVLLCLCRATVGISNQTRHAPSSSDKGEKDVGASPKSDQQHNHSVVYFRKQEISTPKLQGDVSHRNGTSSIKTSRSNRDTTVISGRPEHVQSGTGWAVERVPPICAYRVTEGGNGGQLCFRYTQLGFRCSHGDCRTVLSRGGSLLANILTNGSVLLQWTKEGLKGEGLRNTTENTTGLDQDKEATGAGKTLVERERGTPRSAVVKENLFVTSPPKRVFNRLQVPRGGFGLSCWWNGTYTQFECAGVHLGSGCRDFLLTELHENVPYRICLHPLTSALTPPPHSGGASQGEDLGDCVEFTVSPSGMQDIVIAMTTVGGAICVMLVIICLLVAYITENIMSPTTQHTHSTFHTHSHH